MKSTLGRATINDSRLTILSVQKQIRVQSRSRIDGVLLEVGDAFLPQYRLVDVEITGGFATVALQYCVSGIGHDGGLAARLEYRLGKIHLDGGSCNCRARPQRVHRDAGHAELFRHAERAQ